MEELKKICLIASIAFGTLFLAGALTLLVPYRINARTSSDTTTTTTEEDILEPSDPRADINNGFHIIYNNDSGQISGTVRILLVLTVISLAPSLIIMLTSFTRIIIVLHFLRQAVGTQTAPPNQVLVGLALFLTVFIMSPVFKDINDNAIKPFDEGKITQDDAIEIGTAPLREFMYGQTQEKDLALLCDIAKQDYPVTDEEFDTLPMTTVIPAFILSELRTAFVLGFLIYIPFIVIDMVVSSILMSMGMMMLPPTTISMPFKLLLFILADGWDLVIGQLVKSFF
ncbi:MAG: flagellar type III secretion system pore protein FliP [Lachnospiraceae bacterium]|nr:flagellar type III secretion system pore protein FliP [Lachnospiraceae bacterium]